VKVWELKNLTAFILAFLIVSSTVAFPALAAEQLGGEPVNTPRIGVFSWLRNLLTRLLGSGIPEIQMANPGGLSKVDFTWGLSSSPHPSNQGEAMISSIKDLALAAIEYRDDFNNDTKRANFIQTGMGSITAIDGFIESTKNSGSALAIELRGKLTDFRENIKTTLLKAGRSKLTQDELNQLINDIANATGKRYEKVTFDRYEEREIHPRVLGAGGHVIVHNGELTLPAGVDSPEPLPEDYLPDIDTTVTPEIQALADKLDNNPARIYWWVHENIRYVPYYGAMHGAQQTLISRTGNDVDTTILTVALLRAAGYPARYVYGEAYASREEVFDLLGVDDVPGALRLLWGTGIPAEFDGVGFRMERVWVEVYAPIYPGTRSQWIQLDPSWKKAKAYTKTDQYIQVNSTVNATELQEGATANATINETAGYIQGINTTFIEEYLNNHVNVTELQNITEEFFVPEEVMPPAEVYFPFSMQFGFKRYFEYSHLPFTLKWTINLSLTSMASNNTVLTYQNNLTEMAGLPFAIDFVPTTSLDAQNMQNTSIPAYEINVTPQVWLNSTHVNGTPVPYGSEVAVQFAMTMVDRTIMTKWLYAGEKSGVVIDAPKMEFTAYNRTFERVWNLQNSTQNDTFARESLYLMGSSFFLSSDYHTDLQADIYGVRWARTKPGVIFVTKENKVESLGGIPTTVKNGGTSVDLKFDQIITSADRNNGVAFNLQRGFAISGFEGGVLETFYANTTGISATYILNKGLAENVSTYFISNDTIDRLNNLSIPQGDKEIIQDLLQQSPTYFVIVLANTTIVGNWTGLGYAVIDSETGAGKYLVSGGLAGGSTNRETEDIKWRCAKEGAEALLYGIGAAVYPYLVIKIAALIIAGGNVIGIAVVVFATIYGADKIAKIEQTLLVRYGIATINYMECVAELLDEYEE